MRFQDSLLVLCLLLPSGATAEPFRIVGVASVIDGDTIEIHGERVRLFGIDAPESRQECRRGDGVRWRCGQRAALALQDHIGRRTVTCVQDDIDRYGRSVSHCEVSGEDIGEWLVKHGWAVAYTRYSRQYLPEENDARAAHAGIWSGDFMLPWDWRRRGRKGQVVQ